MDSPAELQPQLARLATKMQQILKQRELLQKENDKLKKQLQISEVALQSQRDLNNSLSQKITALHSTGGNVDEESRKEFERKINQYIKDIDKVITQLNG